ncbi:ribonuclease H-like domain-containing protein [Tanacetum coccineum]
MTGATSNARSSNRARSSYRFVHDVNVKSNAQTPPTPDPLPHQQHPTEPVAQQSPAAASPTTTSPYAAPPVQQPSSMAQHTPVQLQFSPTAVLHQTAIVSDQHAPTIIQNPSINSNLDSVHPMGTDTASLLLYVDDIALTASSEITRDSSGLFLSQKKYALEILDRAHMANCNPSRTPIDTESKLGSDGDPVSNPSLYRSLAGSLQYLTFTRPDISYAVQQMCLYMRDPQEPHFSALKRILRYVRGTLDYGLQLFSSSTTELVAYSDADWARCPTTRCLTSEYCVFLGNNLLFWSFKSQPTLSCSSAEAEYHGVANAVAETCYSKPPSLIHHSNFGKPKHDIWKREVMPVMENSQLITIATTEDSYEEEASQLLQTHSRRNTEGRDKDYIISC